MPEMNKNHYYSDIFDSKHKEIGSPLSHLACRVNTQSYNEKICIKNTFIYRITRNLRFDY